MIRNVTPADIPAITRIYNQYITNTCITFETQTVTDDDMLARMQHITSRYPYLVYETEGQVVGYCYAHEWKEKDAYSLTAETTIYLAPCYQGKGIGRALMKELIQSCKKMKLHVLIACITVPNKASVQLHESLGFKQVSRFYEVGYKFGKLLDIYDFQLLL